MAFLLLLLIPNFAFASLDTIIASTNRLIIQPLINFLFALAVLFFLYGVVQFFVNQENEEKRTEGKKHMVWGIVGITIMMAVWGILAMVLNTFNIQGVDLPNNKVDLPPYNPSLPQLKSGNTP